MKSITVPLFLLLASGLPTPAAPAYDAYGGWLQLTGVKTGYFHTQEIQGRWWLVTPDGNRTSSALAVRDSTCDENLWEMRSLQHRARRPDFDSWKYAHDTPIADLDFRQARLRCYRATSDDFEKAQREPTNEIPY